MFKIFEKLGGEEIALDIIAGRSGEKPTAEAVRGWKRQRRIPGNKAVYLLDECGERGISASWQDDCVVSSMEAAQ